MKKTKMMFKRPQKKESNRTLSKALKSRVLKTKAQAIKPIRTTQDSVAKIGPIIKCGKCSKTMGQTFKQYEVMRQDISIAEGTQASFHGHRSNIAFRFNLKSLPEQDKFA
uniref:hypothetical protein n=1 Tax=Orrella sp. TaxID=1921583 RepID=UPI00404825B7